MDSWRNYQWLAMACSAIALGAFILCWSTGYAGLNGQDAHDYLRIAKGWTRYFHGGSPPVMVEHPHGYPIAGALFGEGVGSELIGLRMISALSLVVIVIVLRHLLARYFGSDQRIGPFVILGIALSPFLLRYSLVVLSDVPAIAMLCIAFYCTLRWADNDLQLFRTRLGWLLLAIVTSVVAITIRFAVVPIIMVLALACVHGSRSGRLLRWRVAVLSAIIGVVVLFLSVSAGSVEQSLVLRPIADLSFSNLFSRDLISDDGVLHYRFPNILYVLSVAIHPGFIPMGLLLIPFLRREDLGSSHAKLGLAIAVFYVLFIGCMPFQNDRVLVMAQPFIVMLFFPAFKRAWEFCVQKGVAPSWVVGALIVLQSGLFVRATWPFMQQAEVERTLTEKVNTLKPARVYTHGMGAAFGTYCPGIEVTELWYGELNAFDPGALIIVQPENLNEQWQGRPPLINWKNAEQQGVDVIEQGADGWLIGRVQ